MEVLKKSKIVRDEPLTGKMFRVINPDNGANIKAEHFYGGEMNAKREWVKNGVSFEVNRGDSVVVDETIAKAACHVWQFLRMEPAPEAPVESVTTSASTAENTGEQVNAENAFSLPVFLDFYRYSWPEIKKIAAKTNLEGTNKMKKDQLYAALNNLPLPTLRQAVSDCGLEFYTNNQ